MTRSDVRCVLILGSAPSAPACRAWPRERFDAIVAINNAWALRDDFTHLIYPDDFPPDRLPPGLAPGQLRVTSDDYVPEQNRFGGVLYAGGTMAFTAGYWALGALRPDVLAFFGCDMVYPGAGRTHFYGTGAADPLRDDISLRNLEAKSARLTLLAAEAGCHAVNLSEEPHSRLVMPRLAPDRLPEVLPQLAARPPRRATDALQPAHRREAELGYVVSHGRYWEESDRFDPAEIDRLDQLWLQAWTSTRPRPAEAPTA
ncbi:hypothetical protein [Marinibacterium profundimaris]|uniref:Uncharacterized protein n=1 Tax=Marinibacterium profundimaris TaxID=1679460 RepID=A0A225NI47_9RHOB|nr:hypothetical protein [Marinibacterium profundimaris]OWU73280.1 hypothetical protein ATO3_11300 [Marinibacterium profundimaris]